MKLYRIEYGDRYKDVGIEADLYDPVIDESRQAYLVPIHREVYVTICENHSGGPASPHTVDCFVPYTLSDLGEDTE